jgi:hypothetical protein
MLVLGAFHMHSYRKAIKRCLISTAGVVVVRLKVAAFEGAADAVC